MTCRATSRSSPTLSRRQLRTPKRNELFFMFMRRWEHRWRFVLTGREQLLAMRTAYEGRDRARIRGPGMSRDVRLFLLAHVALVMLVSLGR